MDTFFICLTLAMLLIFVPRTFVVIAQIRQPGGYNNSTPRDQQSKLEGWGKRAQAAHMNAFEAFILFLGGVVTAHLMGADQDWSNRLAVSFIVARTLYTFAYIYDWPTFRSIIWIVGLVCTIGLYLLPWVI